MLNFNYVRRAFRASKYGKVALTVLFVGLIAASVSLGGNLQPADLADAAGSFSVSCSGSPSPVQSGGTVTWTATATGGSGGYAYLWNGNGVFPDGTTANPVSVTYAGANDGPRTASVSVTSGGVTKTANCSVDLIGAGNSLSCSGPSTLVMGKKGIFTASGGTGTYSWATAGGNPSSGAGNTFSTSYNAVGGKTVKVTSGGQSATCPVQVTSAFGNPAPLNVSCSGANSNPSDPEINPGDTVKWTATASGGSGSYSFSWTGNGSFPSGVTGNPITHTYLGGVGQRNANVTVTSGGQTDTASCHIQVVDPGSQPGCVALQFTDITLSGNTATAKVTNPNPASSNCARTVGLVSFSTPVAYNVSNRQQFLEAQVRFDSELVSVPGGTNSKTLSVSIPDCEFQVDFFQGDYIPTAVQIDNGTNGIQLKKFKVSSGAATIPGFECSTPKPPTLSCAANPPSARIGENVSFTASGGNGTYSWTTAGGNPSSGSGSIFNTSYSEVGGKTAKVTSGGQSATCPVTIFTTVIPQPPSCSPANQTVAINQAANIYASGGNGVYSWNISSGSGGSPSSGSGSSFHPSFSSAGTKTITLTSNGQTDQCTVIVQQAPPGDISCSPLNQTADVNETVTFNASGGDGAFHWTGGGSPSTGNSQQFQTSWSSSGAKHVLVSDNSGHTAQCNAQINDIIVGAPVCSPSNQDADIDENVNFFATGGSGSYHWTANSGSNTSGSGANFNTSFDDDGTHLVTVTSNGLSDSCLVHIDDDDEELECSPSNQDADVGDFVTFRASGGSGSYHWTADEGDADPDSDTGRTFTTQFDDEGRHTVRVRDSEGRRATCRVDIEEDFSPRRLSCSPSYQTARVNEQVKFFANGGTGDFEWDADDGRPRSGFGSRFTTSFDRPGRYEVELESNGRRDTCEVEIVEDDDDAPFCSPSVQNANVGDFVTFRAIGGNGTFFWNTSADGSPSTGSGSSFGTRFLTSGNKIVTVNSNGRTSQCVVQIGSVLGASTVVTGPTETAAAAAGLGFLGALGAYGAVYRERSKKILSKIKRLVRR